MIEQATDPWLMTLDVGGAVIIAATIQLIGTMVAAAVAHLISDNFKQQSKLNRIQTQSRIDADALQTIHEYIECPYRVLRRDGSPQARMDLTNRISDIQVRLRYYEELLRLESTTDVADAYAAAAAAARREAGSAMTSAWRRRPTRSDKNVPIGERIETPDTIRLLVEVRDAMRRARD